MITIWIHVIVILYLMAHITLYQMYYPMLLNRTHQKFKDSRAIKVLNIKLHYMSNKFYEFMFAFLIYFFGVSNLVFDPKLKSNNRVDEVGKLPCYRSLGNIRCQCTL